MTKLSKAHKFALIRSISEQLPQSNQARAQFSLDNVVFVKEVALDLGNDYAKF